MTMKTIVAMEVATMTMTTTIVMTTMEAIAAAAAMAVGEAAMMTIDATREY